MLRGPDTDRAPGPRESWVRYVRSDQLAADLAGRVIRGVDVHVVIARVGREVLRERVGDGDAALGLAVNRRHEGHDDRAVRVPGTLVDVSGDDGAAQVVLGDEVADLV